MAPGRKRPTHSAIGIKAHRRTVINRLVTASIIRMVPHFSTENGKTTAFLTPSGVSVDFIIPCASRLSPIRTTH